MKKIYQYISALFLSGLLMLLTIGLPVAYNTIKELKQSLTHSEVNDGPYSNTTEEKTPSNLNLSEEYVHDHHHHSPTLISLINGSYEHTHEAIYMAYHGELHCPPPNFLS
ncbi:MULTISPECIES: hypothetical protein [Chitinophagaceae]|uniref:Uncharacterized protein n=2 Tax=Chitinophagaceae TaxID=563835 RepID=A0ABU7RFK1_9BACT